MVDLAGHRPEPAHLPHQPFEHRHLAPHVALRPELAGLLAEINEDRAGFENADRRTARAVAVDDRRDPVVGADLEEIGLELLALADIHRLYRIGQPHFLERDADLAAVRRVPGPQFDAHRRVSSARERGGPQHRRDAPASQDAIAPGGARARPGLPSARVIPPRPEKGTPMAADPNRVILTGENPFIRLSAANGGPGTTNASYWRIITCPAGPGHVLYLKSELTDNRWRIYSDNIAMARWLQGTVQGMLNPETADLTIPVVDSAFSKEGEPRYFWTERID